MIVQDQTTYYMLPTSRSVYRNTAPGEYEYLCGGCQRWHYSAISKHPDEIARLLPISRTSWRHFWQQYYDCRFLLRDLMPEDLFQELTRSTHESQRDGLST